MWQIPLFKLNYDQTEAAAINEVMTSQWLTAGPKTAEFEQQFSAYLKEETYCCALSSCTAALHIALLLAGIGHGDEVIIPGLTFVADLNVVQMVGATPVVADSTSLTDWNISVTDIANKITSKTKALIIVHYAGYPCDMTELMTLCKERNILLIEDVAHAVGAEYKKQKCGTFGDMACFSFFSNKNLSIGEGGMLVCRNKDLDTKARLFRSHGMTSMTIDRHEGKTISYDVVQPGLNYRIDELRSALGIVQLKKLDNNNKQRKTLSQLYMKHLKQVDHVSLPWQDELKHRTSAYHIFPILLDRETNRNKFIHYMKDHGIQTSCHYPAFKKFSFYKNIITETTNTADDISNRVVTLPLFPSLKKTEIQTITMCIKNYFSQVPYRN